MEELDATGAVSAQYTQSLGIDEPLAMYRNGGSFFYHADGLGSIAALTDTTGSPAAAYVYDSFGNLIAQAGQLTNPFRYTAREFDSETGLYYYRARYYDSSVGRFLNEDPIRFRGDIDFYSYVGNNPGIWLDGFGLARTCRKSPKPCDAALPCDPDARLLAQVIFAEATRGTGSSEDSAQEMAAIAYTIINRANYLQDNPRVSLSYFGATARSIRGVVTRSQFGSVGSPLFRLAATPSRIQTSTRSGANNCNFLKAAISVAQGTLSGAIEDPYDSLGGVYAFRTKGSGPPGGDFFVFDSSAQLPTAGNTFYGLNNP